MKKIFSLIFIFIILLQSGGMVWWFKLKQFAVQYEMSLHLDQPSTLLETLVMSENEYHNFSRENGKEINWQGKLYDIKSGKIKNGKVTLLAVNDSSEENLLLHFTHFLKHSRKNTKQERTSSISKLLVFTCIIPNLNLNISNRPEEAQLSPSSSFACKTFQTPIASPPPKLVL